MKAIEMIHQFFLEIRLIKESHHSLGNKEDEKILPLSLKYLNLLQAIFNTINLTKQAKDYSGNLAQI